MTICLSEPNIEGIIERETQVMGNGHDDDGDQLLSMSTNSAEKDCTTAIIDKSRTLVCTLKELRVGKVMLSGILPIKGSRGKYYKKLEKWTTTHY